MAELFDKDRKTITEHIQNIFKESELEKNSVCRKFQHTALDKKKYDVNFFATVQNKIHYAVHGQTAAEMIAKRADSKKPLMGLTNFKGDYITTNDIAIAKNYLSENELKKLNLISVSLS